MDKSVKLTMEARFRNYHKYAKEIKYRKWDLEHKETDINADIKSKGRTGNPTESLIIKWEQDPYISNRVLWVNSIDKVLNSMRGVYAEIVKEYYFDDMLNATEIGDKYGYSKATVHRILIRACTMLAKEVGEEL